jgi:transposase-like protein
MPECLQFFGTEAASAEVVRSARWSEGFACPRCEGRTHCIVVCGGRILYQCHTCRRQTSLTAGTFFGNTKLPLTRWFLAMYSISQAQTGLSDLAMKRQLGVSHPTAWLLHHKMNRAMAAPICRLRPPIQPPLRLARRGVAPDRRRLSVRAHQGTGAQTAC